MQTYQKIAKDQGVIVEKEDGPDGQRYAVYNESDHSMTGHCKNLKDDWNWGKDKFGTIPKKRAKVFLDAADEKNVRVGNQES